MTGYDSAFCCCSQEDAEAQDDDEADEVKSRRSAQIIGAGKLEALVAAAGRSMAKALLPVAAALAGRLNTVRIIMVALCRKSDYDKEDGSVSAQVVC